MTYKTNSAVAKITCPVITVIDGKETRYENSQALVDDIFEKNYVIESMSARNDEIVIFLSEKQIIFGIGWIGEEEIMIQNNEVEQC